MADAGPVFDSTHVSSPLSVPGPKTALFLMDFHEWLVGTMPPEGKAALETAAKIRQWARNRNMLIIHCLIDFNPEIPTKFKMARTASVIRDKILKDGPHVPKEAEQIAPLGDEYVFKRPLGYLSALSSYGIQDFLNRLGIESVILSGVATSGCVIDTAKAAAEKGLVVTVVKDACADRAVETHEFVMNKLLGRQCHVANMDDIVTAWN